MFMETIKDYLRSMLTEGTPNRRQGDLFRAYKRQITSGSVASPIQGTRFRPTADDSTLANALITANRGIRSSSLEDRVRSLALKQSVLAQPEAMDIKNFSLQVPGFDPASDSPLKIPVRVPRTFTSMVASFERPGSLGSYRSEKESITGHPSKATGFREIGQATINPLEQKTNPDRLAPTEPEKYFSTLGHEVEHGVQNRRLAKAVAYPEQTVKSPETRKDINPREVQAVVDAERRGQELPEDPFTSGMPMAELNAINSQLRMTDTIEVARDPRAYLLPQDIRRRLATAYAKRYDDYRTSDVEMGANRSGAIAVAAHKAATTGNLMSLTDFSKTVLSEPIKTGRKSRKKRVEKAIQKAFGRVAVAQQQDTGKKINPQQPKNVYTDFA